MCSSKGRKVQGVRDKKPLSNQVEHLPYKKNTTLFLSTTLGPWCHSLRVESPFLTNGCSKSNMGSMMKSNDTRQDLWQEVSPKHLESITMKLLHPLQSLCQFVVSLHLRPLKTWKFIKWTSKPHLSMVTLKRRSTWSNPKDSHMKANILCVRFISHCMA